MLYIDGLLWFSRENPNLSLNNIYFKSNVTTSFTWSFEEEIDVLVFLNQTLSKWKDFNVVINVINYWPSIYPINGLTGRQRWKWGSSHWPFVLYQSIDLELSLFESWPCVDSYLVCNYFYI